MSKKKSGGVISVGIKLMVITSVTVLLLALVNNFTAEKIAILEKEKQDSAMQSIFPEEGNAFLEMPLDAVIYDYPKVSGIYTVYNPSEDKIIGYCVLVSAKGYGGDTSISMLVGLNPSFMINQIEIISNEETPGIGSKAMQPEFLSQFVSHTSPIEYQSGGLTAISGATRSSNGIKYGLNDAVDAVKKVIFNNPQDIEEQGGTQNDQTDLSADASGKEDVNNEKK